MDNNTNAIFKGGIETQAVLFEVSSLFEYLGKIRDPPKPRGIRYHLAVLVGLLVLAKLCGADITTNYLTIARERLELEARGELATRPMNQPTHEPDPNSKLVQNPFFLSGRNTQLCNPLIHAMLTVH